MKSEAYLTGQAQPAPSRGPITYLCINGRPQTLQKISKAPSKHSGVISLFDKEFVMKGIFDKTLSKDFHRAFELRQSADYKIIKPMSTGKANEIWQKAVNFVQALEVYLNKN